VNVQMRLNTKFNGIELQFSEKPPQDILDQLGHNGHGFRWHFRNKYWFAKQTPERLAFARKLAGLEEEMPSPQEPKATYRYYSTQRPVDIGTYPKAGGAFLGFENFDQRQPVEDGSFLAWGWLEYTRPLTEKEQDDYELRPARPAIEKEIDVPHVASSHDSGEESAKAVIPNTFAANYDMVGDDIRILESSDLGFFDFRAAYFKDKNLYVQRTGCGDCLSVLSLDNAGKSGKVCQEWKFSATSWPKDDVCTKLFNEHGIHTVKQLWETCLCQQEDRSRFLLDGKGVRLSNYQRKATNVFSPFQEVKPLKGLPEKWTKRNISQALLSGQIYAGQIDRYDSDYSPDLAGARLNMPFEARDVVEDWSTLSSVRTVGDPDEHGISTLRYSDGPNTSKTLWFDPSCDIAEGKRREQAHQAGIRQYNDMLKQSCIQPDPASIEAAQIYTVQALEQNDATGVLQVKEQTVQGFLLRSRIEEEFTSDLLSIAELEIEPEQLYQITSSTGNSHSTSDLLAEDERVIPCGNWMNLITGKALLELTGEETYVPMVRTPPAEYATVEQALATLEQFARGKTWFAVSGLTEIGYEQAIQRLLRESNRAGCSSTRSLDVMLQAAQCQQAAQSADRKTRDIQCPER